MWRPTKHSANVTAVLTRPAKLIRGIHMPRHFAPGVRIVLSTKT